VNYPFKGKAICAEVQNHSGHYRGHTFNPTASHWMNMVSTAHPLHKLSYLSFQWTILVK